ncbi:MAG: hypothetical protein JW862_06715 [Anaerolineales bacterium]|nr:hypothetical protein [Anaerolineales bacterium]
MKFYKYQERLREQVEDLLEEIERANDEEADRPDRPEALFLAGKDRPDRPEALFSAGGDRPDRPEARFSAGGDRSDRPEALFSAGKDRPDRPEAWFLVGRQGYSSDGSSIGSLPFASASMASSSR